jgi:hypothetical protein
VAVVAVAPTQPPALLAAAEALAAARAYAGDALAPETRRAYAADWPHFTTWCGSALPSERTASRPAA